MKAVLLDVKGMQTPGVHHWAVVIWLRVFDEQEVGTKGPFGLVPYLSRADGGEFLSFQMENESKRRPVLVRS